MSTFEVLLTFKPGAGVTNVDRGGGRRWVVLGSRLPAPEAFGGLQTDRAAMLSGSRRTAPLQALALRHRLGVSSFAYLVGGNFNGRDFQWVRKGLKM